MKYIVKDDRYDNPGIIRYLLNQTNIVHRLRMLDASQEKIRNIRNHIENAKFDAYDRQKTFNYIKEIDAVIDDLTREILFVIFKDEMGSDACDKVLSILNDDLMDNVSFLQKMLKNGSIIDVGRQLQQAYDEGNRILGEISERRLTSLVMEMITTEKEEEEKEELREILSCVMKDVVSDKPDDAAMMSTLLESEAIRTWLAVFAGAEDQEQRRQARRVLAGIIRETEGAEKLGQRLIPNLGNKFSWIFLFQDN